jgi:photosystem II stability/assembly factor-like uncharacterized protein
MTTLPRLASRLSRSLYIVSNPAVFPPSIRRPMRLYPALVLAASASIVSAVSAVSAQPRPRPAAAPAQDPLRFQFLGPVAGGRISAVAGVVGDPKTWYMGAASGGVWKSSDSGFTYVPVFDAQPVQAIGALAVSPSKPSVVWAGTGEAWAIRDADVMGDGVYKSTDAGATWTNVGLRETGRIGRIILHPTNPDVAYVCALGMATGPQQERGVFRTTDGGRTWQRVLFVDERTGCSGLAMDANDPNVLVAGTWEVVMHTWAMFSGGPGSGVYMTRDGGTTWTHLENGLPKSPLGKIDVAIAPSNSKRVFALIQTANQGSLWRSDDGGTSWKTVSWDRTLIGRAGYYIRIEVNPRNENEVLVANSTFRRSMDGGLTFPITDRGCGDCHDIWMDSKNPDHWAETGDAGAGITWNHGRTFTNVNLPIGQMYHVAVDEQVPYYVYSNRQDNGTMRGPSSAPEAGQNSVRQQRAPGGRGGAAGRDSTADSTGGARGNPPPVTSPGDSAARRAAAAAADTTTASGDAGGGGFGGGGSTWDHGLGGCESGFTLPDPSDPDIVWSSCYGAAVTRWDAKTKRARSVGPWIHTLDSPPNELKYRCHWTPPLAVDPFDPKTVYYGCQVIFKTSNAGQSWTVASPDLSTRDTSRIVFSGGIIGDNLGQFYGEVVFAIAPSTIKRGLIWAGTNDGQLWLTRDGAATWTNVTKNVAGLPAWGTIRQIAPSVFDAGTAYVTVDFHMMDNREPYLYKTTDYGRTWTKITGDLPTGGPLTYVMSVAENPNKRGMIFAGTGSAFYYSRDDGAHWTRIREGLPAAPVTWIAVPKARWHDVVVSTYGRGIYVLRDITALEMGATPQAVADDATEGASGPSAPPPARIADGVVRLYPPPAGYREARSGHADLTFAVPSATREPAKLEIMDSTGAVIRTIQATTRAGLNRVTWDLRYDPPTRVDLRTTPPDNPHIWEEPRFKGKQARPIVHWGIDGPINSGPLALPGHYSVRLTANGTTTPPERFSVTRATETTMPMADLVASTKTQIRIRDAMNTTASMINRIEIMRKQLEDQRAKSSADAAAVSAIEAMDKKLLDVELRLLSRTDLHSDDKWYVESYKIYMNLVWLSGEVGTGAGDVAGGAEFRPTDASLAVLAMLEKQLAEAKAAYDRVMRDDVAAFNKAMVGRLPALVF